MGINLARNSPPGHLHYTLGHRSCAAAGVEGLAARHFQMHSTMATSETSPAVGTRLSAAEIHNNVLEAAEEDLERSAAALLWSALAAGLTIG